MVARWCALWRGVVCSWSLVVVRRLVRLLFVGGYCCSLFVFVVLLFGVRSWGVRPLAYVVRCLWLACRCSVLCFCWLLFVVAVCWLFAAVGRCFVAVCLLLLFDICRLLFSIVRICVVRCRRSLFVVCCSWLMSIVCCCCSLLFIVES